jgi:TonB family protein
MVMTSFHTELSGRRIVAQDILPVRMLKLPIVPLMVALSLLGLAGGVAAPQSGGGTIRVTATIAGSSAPAAGVEVTLVRLVDPAVQKHLVPEAAEALRTYLAVMGPQPAGILSAIRMTPSEAQQSLARQISSRINVPVLQGGGNVSEPRLIQQTLPQYSEEARRLGIQGQVVLMVVVLEDGSVGAAEVLQEPGHGLGQNAVAAARTWKFRPATSNGTPVPAYITIMTSFNSAAGAALRTPPVTDSAGNAVVANVANGKFLVIGKREGFVGTSVVNVEPPSGHDIALSLIPTATVRGRIRDANGAPVPARVTLGFASEQDGRRVFIEGALTVTGPTGDYSFASVIPGEFYLRVQRSTSSPSVYYPASPDFERAVSVPVGAGKEIVGIDIDVR